MIKLFHLVFIIFFLLAFQNHKADAATVGDSNQDDETKTTPTIGLIPYANVFDSINSNSKKDFEAFINPQTREIFYSPKTKEALDKLIDKINFSESIYMQARASKQEQKPNQTFLYNPGIYLPFFKKALDEIVKTQLISETNLRDILSYLASWQDTPTLPDIWDSIKDNLGIYYDYNFTEGCLFLDFSLRQSTSEDWIEDTIAAVNDSCKLGIHLGFKLALDKSNPQFGDLYKTAQTYKSKATISPFAASQEYIAMIRSAESLYQLLIERFLASEEFLTRFKSKIEAKYGVDCELRINNNSSKLELLAETVRIISNEDDLSEISLSIQENGEYTFDFGSTLDKYCDKKTAKYRRRDAPVSYTRKINLIESRIADCRANILFAREARKHQPPKNKDDYIFILLDEIREFQKIKQEIDAQDRFAPKVAAPKTIPMTDVQRKKALDKSLKSMSIYCDSQTNQRTKKLSILDKSKDDLDDEDKKVLEAEMGRPTQGMISDAGTKKQMIANNNATTISSAHHQASKNATKRVAAISKSMTFTTRVNSAATASSVTFKRESASSILDLFKKKNQTNINFYNTLCTQSKYLTDATPFATDFFHQAAQPKYPELKNDLISHGFKVVPHAEKDHFCWKANNKFYHVAVDRPHAAQLEKGNAVAWFLRIQQKIAESGIVVAKVTIAARNK